MAYSRNDIEITFWEKDKKQPSGSLPFSLKFQMFLRFQYLKKMKLKKKLEENISLHLYIMN